MNRRGFLQWLGGTAAGVAAASVLDVDRLLWVPGEKTIFLPSPTPVISSASALKLGDIITIEGRYAVHPITRRATRHLQRFIVTGNYPAGNVALAAFHPNITLVNPDPLPPRSKVMTGGWSGR